MSVALAKSSAAPVDTTSNASFSATRPELEQKVAVLLGGRAAEKLAFDVASTGAADDLAKATDIARDMVTRYGMDEGLGYVAFEPKRQQMLEVPPGLMPQGSPVSEHTQRRIDDAIRGIVMGGFDHAVTILEANREVLERGARALLAQETLDEAAIRNLAMTLKRVDAFDAHLLCDLSKPACGPLLR